jgi:hypothetical protein
MEQSILLNFSSLPLVSFHKVKSIILDSSSTDAFIFKIRSLSDLFVYINGVFISNHKELPSINFVVSHDILYLHF